MLRSLAAAALTGVIAFTGAHTVAHKTPPIVVPPAGPPVTPAPQPPQKPLTQLCLDKRLAAHIAQVALADEATRINQHRKPLTDAQALSADLRSAEAIRAGLLVSKALLADC